MSVNLLEAVSQHLTPDTLQQMSASLGTDQQTTSNAVSLALPVLLGGLARNASNPEGAASLDQALNAHDGSILDNLGGMFGGGGAGGLGGMLGGGNAGSGMGGGGGLGGMLGGGGGGGIGGAILGHIFGARRGPVEQGVGRATGMNAQQVAQLLAMLAPIVMGVLGRMKQTKGIDSAQLPNVLQQSTAQQPGLGGLAGMLDSNDDGQIADDISRLGTSVLGGLFKR